MHINDLPQELLSDILLKATKANKAEGVGYTYGLTQNLLPLPSEAPKFTRYVRGPLSAECLRWDATDSIRQTCKQWHDWALSYNFERVFERRWRGSERWADLTLRRPKYNLYELIDKPKGFPLYRDPHGSLKQTDRLFASLPTTAQHVQRLWFNGFYAAETDKLILSVVASCRELQYLSVPWTILRRAGVNDWVNLLNAHTGVGKPLHSLELTAVCLPKDQAHALENDTTPNPLEDARVDFRSLKRLKIFGNTLHKPISDEDLQLMARTATNLECLDITNLSTISVAGMLALVKASAKTLQVLEHSPRSDDGFYHPFPGHLEEGEHVCELLANLPQMRDLSISVPYVCADLFHNHDVKWAGELQVRAIDICGCGSDTNSQVRADKLRRVLEAARAMMALKRRMHQELSVELFFAGCIFHPEKKLVHGDFALAEVASRGRWPFDKQPSTLGPYGQSGRYGKDEGFWDAVSEEDYLLAVTNHWIAL
ncbi:hypothetical protein BAUCODRAFT_73015 [Baudoinia panamericana UAMH 10762]|uniref:F-box domain-containing protein n=1 Tax=Baudoinia panamericana (strain UAMH 10762) TaxID=717646 RepID=M2MUZ2_BAUPA|nr:uncharacterized protein BAUCODRAFT_73015 [Baudoinia panamericana UAMH 10762]EMC95403.1 hypothetical protein BAUCODRAFT_73015 [Baudoinia panamericana UAMH 10762]